MVVPTIFTEQFPAPFFVNDYPIKPDFPYPTGQEKLDAFGNLFTEHSEKINQYIFFRIGDEQIADDLTAQVFMKAWERVDQYHPTGAPVLTWLYTIAHNAIIDHYRTKKETTYLDDTVDVQSDGLTPEEEIELRLEGEEIKQAIKKLTTQQQQVLMLKFMDGLSTEEIARQLGKGAGSIRALQMRALQSLSKFMGSI
jgi:RNA polymerase sigma-70 factor, ECF subfamily